MANKPLPEQALLLKLLRYDPFTGKLFWRERSPAHFCDTTMLKKWNARCARKQAGCVDPLGYTKITLLNCKWLVHRLVWKMITGNDPEVIDHINGVRSDNRFANLRSVSVKDNSRNTGLQKRSKSGCSGVVKPKNQRRWLAQIRDNAGQYVRLGAFESVEAAVAARKAAERRLGFHPNHGRIHPTQVRTIDRSNPERDSAMLSDRLAGMTLSQLGEKYGIDPSYARRICLKTMKESA